MSFRSVCLAMFRFPISLLIFLFVCFFYLLITEEKVLKFLILVIDLSMSLLSSISFCFMYVKVLLWDDFISRISF